MVVKYCPKCEGKPYTKDFNVTVCSICGSALLSEISSEEDLCGRREMSFFDGSSFDGPSAEGFGYEEGPSDFSDGSFKDGEPNPFGFGDLEPTNDFDEKDNNNDELPSEYHASGIDRNKESETLPSLLHGRGTATSGEVHANAKNIGTVIRGKVTNYTNSQKENSGYRRFFIKKILDAIMYKQRFDDTLHSFTVRVNNGNDTFGHQIYADIPVNIHGIVSGGMQLVDNIEVEITGKYCNGILIASSISVLNNGYKSPVKFQHSVKAILYGILTLFALAFLVFIGVSSGGGFFQNIGSFLKTWLIASVIVTVLYFLVTFSKIGIMARMATGKPRKFPLIGILLVSLVLALLFINSFGIGASVGSALSGILSSAVSIIILLIILFVVFKLILGLF